MAYIVTAYIAIAYIVMAGGDDVGLQPVQDDDGQVVHRRARSHLQSPDPAGK